MSDLTEFRDHCRRMATDEHKPECGAYVQVRKSWGWDREWQHPRFNCTGCNPAADRALFARLAGEVDDYLAPAVDLFGEVTAEPMTEEVGMDERKAVGHE